MITIDDGDRSTTICTKDGYYKYTDLQRFCSTSRDYDVVGGTERREVLWGRDDLKYLCNEGKDSLFISPAGISYILSLSKGKSNRRDRLRLFMEHISGT